MVGKQKKISELITYYGKGITPKYVAESSIIVLNQKCVRNNKIDYSFAQFTDDTKKYNGEKFLRIGDILVNSTGQGTAGRVSFVDSLPNEKKIIVDSHILVLRTSNFFEARCLNYFLFAIENALQTFIDGSTGQGEFDKFRLFDLTVSFPHDLQTQQKIVSILTSLDRKIDLNNKTNVELEYLIQTIFDYWFIHFDFPDTNSCPYKSSGGKMIYVENIKLKIPEGWKVGVLSDIANLNPSLSIKKNAHSPYLEMSAIPTNGYMTRKPVQKQYSGGIKFQNGDVIIARITPCLENGKTALITQLDNDVIGFGSTEFINIRAKEKYYISFLALLCRTENFRSYAISKMTGTSGRKRVDAKDLLHYQLIVPPDLLLEKFASVVDIHFKKMTANAIQNQNLTDLRDWLLPLLMNGQVSIKDASSPVNELLGARDEEITSNLWD